jgi:hypothetical protein
MVAAPLRDGRSARYGMVDIDSRFVHTIALVRIGATILPR